MPEAALLEAPLEAAEVDELDSPVPPAAEVLAGEELMGDVCVVVARPVEAIVEPVVDVLWPMTVADGKSLLGTLCTQIQAESERNQMDGLTLLARRLRALERRLGDRDIAGSAACSHALKRRREDIRVCAETGHSDASSKLSGCERHLKQKNAYEPQPTAVADDAIQLSMQASRPVVGRPVGICASTETVDAATRRSEIFMVSV